MSEVSASTVAPTDRVEVFETIPDSEPGMSPAGKVISCLPPDTSAPVDTL